MFSAAPSHLLKRRRLPSILVSRGVCAAVVSSSHFHRNQKISLRLRSTTTTTAAGGASSATDKHDDDGWYDDYEIFSSRRRKERGRLLDDRPSVKKLLDSLENDCKNDDSNNSASDYESYNLPTIGSRHSGVVQEIKAYGAFVRLEDSAIGYDGRGALLHISKIADHFVENPSDYIKVGQEIDVVVLEVSEGRVLVSMQPSKLREAAVKDGDIGGDGDNSETQLASNLPTEGSKHFAVVQQIKDFGAFVRLEDCGYRLHAFLPIGRISDEYVKHPSDYLEVDQRIEVTVIEVDPSGLKVRVSMQSSKVRSKQKDGDSVEDAGSYRNLLSHDDDLYDNESDDSDEEDSHSNLPTEGEQCFGDVISIKKFGAFVRLDCGCDALLPISQISDDYVEHPSYHLALNQRIEVLVESISKEAKVQVSMKPSKVRRNLPEEFNPVTLAVFNLPMEMDNAEATDLFKEYGEVVDMQLLPMAADGMEEFEQDESSRKLSLVTFMHKEDAENCRKKLHKTEIPLRIGMETYMFKIGVQLAREQNYREKLQAQMDEEFELRRLTDLSDPDSRLLKRRADRDLWEIIPWAYY